MLIRPKPSRILFLLAVFALPAFAVIPQDDEDNVVAERHYKRGQKLYQAGQTEQAIEELYTALSVREIYYEAQLLLGRSLMEAKRYREAAATLREIEPPERGAAEGAIDEAKRAVALKPRFAPARKLLSDAYLMKKDYERSEKALKRYLASVRDRTEAAEIKERIEAMRSLGRAKPQKSVQKPITLPQIYKIPHPGYTLEALRYKVEGAVRVEVLVGSDGAIQHALIARGLGFGLDEEALKAARGIEFKPGEVGGKPVSMWMGVDLLFGPIEIEKKREGTPRIALGTVESPATIDSSRTKSLSCVSLLQLKQEGS